MKKNQSLLKDSIVFGPSDVDLTKSPISSQTGFETFVLGAFNPGFTVLPNGNYLMMVRIAEALKKPVISGKIHTIRWDNSSGFVAEAYPLEHVRTNDPRKFTLVKYLPLKVTALTSISWLLPVEIDKRSWNTIHIHYDKSIFPTKSFQEYGIEDARISIIDGEYYMTTCSVGSQRHSTTLYHSKDGLNYQFSGMIMDHQNKDMLLFEGKIDNHYFALTRPLGDSYFPPSQSSPFIPGPSINIAKSPDLLHWQPLSDVLIQMNENSKSNFKLGGGTPPILTRDGWLMLFHGVEKNGEVGRYCTYYAILDKLNPLNIKYLNLDDPVLVSNPIIMQQLEEEVYLEDVVFTTGIIAEKDHYTVASGELDLCCRLSLFSNESFLIPKLWQA